MYLLLNIAIEPNIASSFTESEMEIDYIRIFRDNLGISTNQGEIPELFKLSPAYPNPFNNTIKIDYSLEKRGHVDIEIFDTNGKWIKNLAGSLMSRGKHVVTWSGDDDNGNIISSGTYLVVIRFGTRIKSKKINLIK